MLFIVNKEVEKMDTKPQLQVALLHNYQALLARKLLQPPGGNLWRPQLTRPPIPHQQAMGVGFTPRVPLAPLATPGTERRSKNRSALQTL